MQFDSRTVYRKQRSGLDWVPSGSRGNSVTGYLGNFEL